MSYYQQLWINLAETKRVMVETKGTPEHPIWVAMYRWYLKEINQHPTVCETASA